MPLCHQPADLPTLHNHFVINFSVFTALSLPTHSNTPCIGPRPVPASVVLGAQWGDEGKGKAIDQLAADSTWAVRFQGGNNAGHTIVLGDTTLKLHQIPSGVTSPNCNLVLGDGMVVDPWVLEEELERWYALTKERPEGERLFISERASVILPFHTMYDSADKIVGTTGRGIGPAYRDRIERVGIRFVDIPYFLDDDEKVEETVSRMNKQLDSVGVSDRVEKEDLESHFAKMFLGPGP